MCERTERRKGSPSDIKKISGKGLIYLSYHTILMTKNGLCVVAFAVAFLAISAAGASTSTMMDSGIWQIINGNTITQLNTPLNINIGENISTTSKLNVNGKTTIHGSLEVSDNLDINGASYFNDDVGIDGMVDLYDNIYIHKDIYLATDFSSVNKHIRIDLAPCHLFVDVPTTFTKPTYFNDSVMFNNTVEFKGGITYNGYDVSLLPKYSIQMYGGLSSDFDSNGYFLNNTHWHLCNGLNSTINLTDRFIVGAGSTYAQNSTGGNNSFTIVDNNLPTFVKTCVPTTATYSLINGLVTVVTRVTVTSGGISTPIDNKPFYRGLYYIEFLGY